MTVHNMRDSSPVEACALRRRCGPSLGVGLVAFALLVFTAGLGWDAPQRQADGAGAAQAATNAPANTKCSIYGDLPPPSSRQNDRLSAEHGQPFVCGRPTSQREWRDLVSAWGVADQARRADVPVFFAGSEQGSHRSTALSHGSSLTALASVRLLI